MNWLYTHEKHNGKWPIIDYNVYHKKPYQRTTWWANFMERRGWLTVPALDTINKEIAPYRLADWDGPGYYIQFDRDEEITMFLLKYS